MLSDLLMNSTFTLIASFVVLSISTSLGASTTTAGAFSFGFAFFSVVFIVFFFVDLGGGFEGPATGPQQGFFVGLGG